MGELRLGTQGWNYAVWVGPMYPAGTRPTAFLETYARAFSTVEVDSTFYAIPPARTVRNWAKRVGADFQFALKLPQQITHEQRLIGADDLAAQFFDVARELGQFSFNSAPISLPTNYRRSRSSCRCYRAI
jgi:uncharacterized protein YecE (DUF72 family)